MQKFKLSNVLLHLSWQFHKASTLYCSIDGDEAVLEPVPKDSSVCKLIGPGVFDFTTYFNSLSVFKWRRYTCAEKFYLHIELKGDACTFTQTNADSYSYYPNPLENTSQNIDALNDWQVFDIELDIDPSETIHAFRIEVKNELFIRNAYYYTKVDEAKLHDVELALCTTTFKKEKYVERNVDIINKRLLASNEEVVKHFHMHIIDNGRTLTASELENDHISVHPNPNAGGAGGFARGMIEALEQTPKATHVLLMDDDVRISTESIVRTYQLLRIVNDEYKEAFLSGAMMNMDEPEARAEDIGFMDNTGRCLPLKPWARMSVLHDVTYNEAFTIPESVSNRPDIYEYTYAAWWYCVIPSTVIEKNGLPLPIFVRCDDIEYGLRCHPKLMCMSGICVWHEPFTMRYSPTAERYQTVRNTHIGRFTTNMAPIANFYREFKRAVRRDIRRFNYDDVELSLQGFEDFLAGPSFIAKPGQAEESFLTSLKNQEKFQSFKDAYDEVKEMGIDLNNLSTCEILQLPPLEPRDRIVDKVKKRFTFEQLSGQRFAGSNYHRENEPVIIDAKGYPSYDVDLKINHRETVIAIDIEHKGLSIRKYDQKRFDALWQRFKDDLKQYEENEERLRQEYGAAREILTSIPFWKAYLGIDGRKCDENGYGIIEPDEFGGLVHA